MKNFHSLLMSFILIFAGINSTSPLEGSPIAITILYDNYVFSEGTKSDWGFSCLIKGTEKTILFDTGTRSDILFHNINRLKVNPNDVETIVISHNHGDHTGGLLSFLKENNKVSVYLPASSPEGFVRKIESTKAKVFREYNSVEICKNVFLTGEMGEQIKEQSLIINTKRGLVVVTGCSHPGIVNIIKRAKEIIDKNIYLVCGGFHLYRKSEEEVRNIISQFKELGVLKVGATHCTGEKQIELFKKVYGENYVQMGVGKVIKISD